MIWHLLGIKRRSTPISIMQARVGKAQVTAIYRREASLSFVKKTRWSEADVTSLPAGEHDYFERKAGALIEGDRNNLLDALAKAASAFSSSGGGHLVIGIRDDGSFDGAPQIFSGRETTRDWLEQKLPDLVDYRLSDFRVHVVERADPSQVPAGRDVIVVDFGDSSLAPHQSRRHTTYFYRSAGRSIPAPHFYLELLRQRLTSPDLVTKIEAVDVDKGWEHNGELYIRVTLTFAISNEGRVAAYKWALVPEQIAHADGRGDDYIFGPAPGLGGRMTTEARIDDTILPGCGLKETKIVSLHLRPVSRTRAAIEAEARSLLSEFALIARVATETSAGHQVRFEVGPLVNYGQILQSLTDYLQPDAQS